MARQALMNWRGEPHFDWRKMYRGVPYRVTCDELNAPRTKDGSYQAANDWWRKKQAELFEPDARYWAQVDTVAAKVINDVLAPSLENLKSIATDYKAMPDRRYQRVAERIEAYAHPAAEAVPADKTVGHLVELWIQAEGARYRAGKLGANRLGMNRLTMNHVKDFLGSGSAVTILNSAKWLEVYTWLAREVEAGKWSVAHADRIFGMAKRFVRFCWSLELIDLPRNLDDKALSFTVPVHEVEVFNDDEVKRLLSETTGQSKLHALLMLNCGFQGMDIATLRHSEVDWTAGIITRKRTKTKGHRAVPVVRWKLWPETFALLQEWRSADPEVVLLTLKGNRWIREELKADGKLSRSDMVGRNLDYWLDRCKIKRSPKQLRATGASKLAEHPQYKFYTVYFLGHSPRGIVEKHYVKPTDREFFEALDWLRLQYMPA